MILEKFFCFTKDQGCIISNSADVETYIKEKVNHFKKHNNWASKKEHMDLYDEILNMINEDLQHPTIDTAPVSNIKFYDKYDTNELIIFYDLVYILGRIIYEAFDYGENALHHIENGRYGPINLGDMLECGYKEFVNTKRNKKSYVSYGSTLIFVIIIEAEIKSKIKNILLQELVKKTIRNGINSFSAEELDLVNCLTQNKDDFNYLYVTTQGADSLFEKYNIYDTQEKNEQKKIILNNITLNQLIQSKIFNNLAEPTFFKIMKLLYGNADLKFRNDILHGLPSYKNYYSIYGTGLLYFIVTDILNDFWKK